MLPFLLRDVTDTFTSLGHLGLYTGLHYLWMYICRHGFGIIFPKRELRWLMMLALSASIAGQICSGLASNTRVFLLGRCLSGCGTAGITHSVIFVRSTSENFARCTQQRATAVLDCVALLLGTL